MGQVRTHSFLHLKKSYISAIFNKFKFSRCLQRDPDGTHAVLLIQNCNNNTGNLIINNIALEDTDSKPITSEVFQDDDFIFQEIDGSNSDEVNFCTLKGDIS